MNRIWISGILQNTEFQIPFLSHPRQDRPAFMAHLQRQAPAQDAAASGEPVDPDLLPERLFHTKRSRFEGPPGPAGQNAFLYLRGDVCEVLRRHDLGHAILHDVDLFQFDTTTPVGASLTLVTPGASRNTIDIARSGLRRSAYNERQVDMPFPGPKMSSLVAVPDLPDTPAIWADPQIPGYPFFSDALQQDLEAAGFKPKTFDLYPIQTG